MNKLSASAKVYLAFVFIVLYAPIFYLIFFILLTVVAP